MHHDYLLKALRQASIAAKTRTVFN